MPTRESYVTASVWPGAGGILLLTAELNMTPPARQELTSALMGKLEHRWSELSRTGQDLEPDTVLEQVLIEANSVLKLYERLLGNPLAPRYHVAISFLRGLSAAAAAVGHCAAFIVSQDGILSITQPEGGTRRPAKPVFEHVSSGIMTLGETLLIATPALMDYLSSERLRQLTTEHPPGFSLREIEKFMISLKVHPPLGVICLKPELAAAAGQDTDSSLQHLMSTRAATSQLLKPSFWLYLKSKFSRHQGLSGAEPTPAPEPEPARPLMRDGSERRPSALARAARQAGRLKWLTDREMAKTMVSQWLERRLMLWRRLSVTKRITLALALILLVAFCQSIVQLGKRNLTEKQSEEYNSVITVITERQAAAESALIYQDDTGARSLLDDAYALLATLPQDSRQRELQWRTLSQSLELTRQRLERKAVISELQPWAQLPVLENDAWNLLVVSPSAVIAVSANRQAVSVDQAGKVASIGTLSSSVGTPLRLISLDKEVLVLGTSGQALINGNSVSDVPSPLPARDAAWYDGRVYYLDTEGKAIYRTSRQGAGFAPAVRWLKANQSLPEGSISLAVDGSIFVAGPDKVQRYTKGAVQEFPIQPLEPALSGIGCVRTDQSFDLIYTWEPSGRRLAAFDKQGKLMVQTVLPDTVRDVSVDGLRKEAYILSGNAISRLNVLSALGR